VDVVRSAYGQRPTPRRPHTRLRVALALALPTAPVALSPAGATVGRLLTHALVARHRPPALSSLVASALMSLPGPGRLLLSVASGAWLLAADGSVRRLDPWTDADRSPRGLYVAVSRANLVGRRGWLRAAPARSRSTTAARGSLPAPRCAHPPAHEPRTAANWR
jgi:hypothetical protein